MGAGASSGLSAALSAVIENDLATLVKEFPPDVRDKLAAACRPAAGSIEESLIFLGTTATLELAPSQITKQPALPPVEGKPSRKPGYTLERAFEEASVSGASPPLASGTAVFVNWVKPNMEHVDDIAKALQMLRSLGLRPVPHLPACRFDSLEGTEATCAKLHAVCGGKDTEVLLLGGNDQHERGLAGCLFPSAGALASTKVLAKEGQIFSRVHLAGHPDGHAGLANCPEATARLLESKVEMLLRDGHDVGVCAQFCFDPRTMISWLHRTRNCISEVMKKNGFSSRSVTYHVSVPGPTPRAKLKRISEICAVPSLFLGSVFDMLDLEGDGVIHESELLAASVMLDVEPEVLSKLHKQFCGDDGVLQRAELAEVIAKLGEEASQCSTEASESEGVHREAQVVSGPSTQVAVACGAEPAKEPDVLPCEAIMALASYCQTNEVPAGEVKVHFFPFGGVAKTTKLMADLATGRWPIVDSK